MDDYMSDWKIAYGNWLSGANRNLKDIQDAWYKRSIGQGYIKPAKLTNDEPKFKLNRPQQLLKEAQSRHPEWQIKRLDNV